MRVHVHVFSCGCENERAPSFHPQAKPHKHTDRHTQTDTHTNTRTHRQTHTHTNSLTHTHCLSCDLNSFHLTKTESKLASPQEPSALLDLEQVPQQPPQNTVSVLNNSWCLLLSPRLSSPPASSHPWLLLVHTQSRSGSM